MTGARKNSLFVLDDGETYAGEGLELLVTDAELERIQGGEKIYNVIPDWDDPRRDLPSGVPNVPALKPESVYETVLKYQMRMGWADRTTVMVLCDYIDCINPSTGLSFGDWLETRRQEEESWCPSPKEEDDG